ncbi:MAG TPA: CoA transferase [Ramlibacter sp.]|nr:CoA transferase [Ramlibacter sp.]
MKPLQGVRVVEMGLWVAGPAAAGILADWGADVVKVEMTAGDPMRRLFGALSGSKEERCPPFDLYNRGKKSLALDTNQPQGLEVVRRLLATADVFVTNMRPQYLQRVGLDADRLAKAHPRLVYASLTAYGLEGPDRDAPGYDMAAFAGRSGVLDRATPLGEAPPAWPGGMGDNVTAMALVAGICAALYEREKTGRGQLVATSLLRTGIYSVGMDLSTRVGLGRIAPVPPRTKPLNPLMNCYRAADGKWFWLVGAESERHWPGIAQALGAPQLLADERFAGPRDRRRHAEALVAAFDGIFATRSRDEWAAVFREHEVWWAPIQSADDLLADPQVAAVRAFVQVPDAQGRLPEQVNGVATPVDFGGDFCGPAGAVPKVGAHADPLLADLGFSAAEIAQLREAGVLARAPEAQA